MKIFYISPSTIPSRSANSIHVTRMCQALAQLGYDVDLFAKTDALSKNDLPGVLDQFYGIQDKSITLVAVQNFFQRGDELLIALLAFLKFATVFFGTKKPGLTISRNLYAAFLFGLILRQNIIYETHSPEKGFRKFLQSRLLKSARISSVVISNALRKILVLDHNISVHNIHVFHDAAVTGLKPSKTDQKISARNQLLAEHINLSGDKKKIVGYFGHLYEGRGIEIIEGLAASVPEYSFIVYGGTDELISQHLKTKKSDNLIFMGHISPAEVRLAMSMMDVLLMPYQKVVSIGIEDVDTSKWMSPMKMFEYMSVGIPIIASNLPVLSEVLVHEGNCLLAEPNDISDWKKALVKLANSPDLADKISLQAFSDYENQFTWKIRAERMIATVGNKKNQIDCTPL